MLRGMSLTPTPPTVPALPGKNVKPTYDELVTEVKKLYDWGSKMNLFLANYLQQLAQNSNTATAFPGPDLVAAPTIAITNAFHHVTGSGVITTVNPPKDFAGGPIFLGNEGSWSLGVGGNIEVAVTPLLHGLVELYWHPLPLAHWHPIALVSSTASNSLIPVIINITDSPFSASFGTFIIVDCTGGPVTINLPAMSGSGNFLVIKKIDGTPNAAIVTPHATDLLDTVNAPLNNITQLRADNYYDYATGKCAVW